MPKKNNVKDMVKYLVGIPQSECGDSYATFQKKQLYRILRKANSLRSAIMLNLEECKSDPFSTKHCSRLYNDLVKDGIVPDGDDIVSAILSLNGIIETASKAISAETGESIFEEIFVMPNGNKTWGIRKALEKSITDASGKYINAPEGTPSVADEKFAEEYKKAVSNPSFEKVKAFVNNEEKTSVFVDCENASPTPLYEVIKKLPQDKLKEVVLINDSHTTPLWDEFDAMLSDDGYTVRRKEAARIKSTKSVVDQSLIVEAMETYYKEKQRRFIFASSDSDIAVLIRSLAGSNCLVLFEKEKFCAATEDALQSMKVSSYDVIAMSEGKTTLADANIAKAFSGMLETTKIELASLLYKAAGNLCYTLTKADAERYLDLFAPNIRTVIEKGVLRIKMD